MEQLNGWIQKASRRSKKQALDMGCSSSYRSARHLWLIPLCCLTLAGCSLKPALMTGAATTAAVGVTSALAPGVLVPAVVGGTTAVIASAMTAVPSVKAEPISVTADTVVTHAPTNIWDVVSQFGLWAGLIILIPLVLGILLPGPVQFKRRG